MKTVNTKIGLLAIAFGKVMIGCKPDAMSPTRTQKVDEEQTSTVSGVLVEQP